MKLCFTLLILALVEGSVADFTCGQANSSANVKTFHGKTIKVKIPCKYNAVRQKCGRYFVNLTPGLKARRDKFRLESIWLGVRDGHKGGTLLWGGRTFNKKTVKFINGAITEFFKKKAGNTATSALFNFTIEKRGDLKVATATVGGVFTVAMLPWDPDNSKYDKSWWSLTCHASDFEIEPYPQQVCGASKDDGFKDDKKISNSELTADGLFLYNVLVENDTDITQVNDLCQKAEDIFQNTCKTRAMREDAIITCGQILTSQKERACITKETCDSMGSFVCCLEWSCGGYINDTVCEHLARSIDFCKDALFQDGNLTGKIKAANCYDEYIPIKH